MATRLRPFGIKRVHRWKRAGRPFKATRGFVVEGLISK